MNPLKQALEEPSVETAKARAATWARGASGGSGVCRPQPYEAAEPAVHVRREIQP